MAINPGSNKVYVTYYGTSELTIIDWVEPSQQKSITSQKEQVFGDFQEIDGYYVETVAENLQVPWAIAFAPDGRIFFTERV